METSKISLEFQLKGEKDKLSKRDKEFDKLKTERAKFETKAQAFEAELNVSSRLLIHVGNFRLSKSFFKN